ncbi:MAG TPA: DUF6577 family protein [Candidatus Lokiarchaeia archaeon]|nr:DUF6577 family protein [Candidatus Lokiarchaeia archaeon]
MAIHPIPGEIRIWIENVQGIITPERVASEFGSSLVSASNYLSRLEQEGLLKRIARGEYIVNKNLQVNPQLSEELIAVHQCIKEKAPHLSFVIWSMDSFKQLFHDIPLKSFIFIEVKEKSELAAIKEFLFDCDKEAIIEPRAKQYADILFKKDFPVILLKRSAIYGCTVIEGIKTAILEKCIIDIYYYMTRDDLPFPMEEFKAILENAIKAGNFNFSFASRYARMRNLDFEFDLIFTVMAAVEPGLVSKRPTRRIKKFAQVMVALFGDRWVNYVVS